MAQILLGARGGKGVMTQNTKLVIESNLQAFFFEHLFEINNQTNNPLSLETIYYSSTVLNNFSDSSKLYEQVNEKTKEKILGIKLMESSQFPREKQRVILKDIAETSLFLCGYFSESLNKKIVDIRYYEEVGKIAYLRLNSFAPDFFDVPSFYKIMSEKFDDVTFLLRVFAKKYLEECDPYKNSLIGNIKV